jgi:hypothetical protein
MFSSDHRLEEDTADIRKFARMVSSVFEPLIMVIGPKINKTLHKVEESYWVRTNTTMYLN